MFKTSDLMTTGKACSVVLYCSSMYYGHRQSIKKTCHAFFRSMYPNWSLRWPGHIWKLNKPTKWPVVTSFVMLFHMYLLASATKKKKRIGQRNTCRSSTNLFMIINLSLSQNHLVIFWTHTTYAHCLKITKNVAFKFLNFGISTNFCLIKTDLSGNTVWPQASGFQKLAKMDHFWHF